MKRVRHWRNSVWRNRAKWQRSFLLLVGMPVVVCAIYLMAVCSERYVAEARFAIKGSESRPVDLLSGFAGLPAGGESSIDSFILQEYIASRSLVEAIEKTLPLESMFSLERVDWLSRMPVGLSMEDKRQYWRKRVSSAFDPTTTLTVLRVTAFRAQDAANLAEAIIKESEHLINALSDQARRDDLAFAQHEVTRAELRVQLARQAMNNFRRQHQHFDPTQVAVAQESLIAQLEQRLAILQADRRAALVFMHPNSAAIKTFDRKIFALQGQIKQEKSTVDARDGGSNQQLSEIFSQYEPLLAEQTFAERAYGSALGSLESARMESARKHRYLASFVKPLPPQEATEPNRWKTWATVTLSLTLLWGIGALSIGIVRDHMGWL